MGKINRDIGFFLFSFFISLLVVFIFLFIYCSCFSEPNDFCFVIDSNLSKADEVSFETEAKKYILMYPNNTRVLLFRNPASENKSYKEVCKFL